MFQNSAMFEPTMEWNGNKSSGFICPVLSLTTFLILMYETVSYCFFIFFIFKWSNKIKSNQIKRGKSGKWRQQVCAVSSLHGEEETATDFDFQM